jgi:CheY-like chemotaxis protein
MANILSVSAEPALLYTRSLLLERTGAFVESACPEDALLLLESFPVDLVVLCHSLVDEDAQQLCRDARLGSASSKVLLIESPVKTPLARLAADYCVSLEDGPSGLIHAAQCLLAGMAEEAINVRLPLRSNLSGFGQETALQRRTSVIHTGGPSSVFFLLKQRNSSSRA